MKTTKNTPAEMDKKQLIKASILAFVIGGLVLVTMVLPAEYGIDPLGTGKLFGISNIYVQDDEIAAAMPMPVVPTTTEKITIDDLGSPAEIVKPMEANNPAPETQFALQRNTLEIVVPARKGIEYKVNMLKYGSTKYEWSTVDNSILYTDFHGEVKEANPPAEVFYESYTIVNTNNMAGTFTAPFEGKQGWYFKNDNNHDVTVILKLEGQYEVFMP